MLTRRIISRGIAFNIVVCLLLAGPTASFAGEDQTGSAIKPEIESVSDTVAFIRWTVSNPQGTILHYAVVEYGKDPKHLSLSAKSPTRINVSNHEMVFRARVGHLDPGCKYYYRAYSAQANGVADSEPSAIGEFTTREHVSRY
ncbi:MAG TPA: fibronectin type III domain-containing protein [Candidatus Binatia bacterium]|nr:fibronectin type III domain-containing protein [Candidatus Binatia bacterium]